ncbi:hypothetical protein [Nostoc sp.]|uniref:hypothetical protein n=1 Tax=Nostoc sp. TaxID=1180 RepID=UPI002FF4EA71
MDWRQFFKSVSLSAIASEPLIDCCTSTKEGHGALGMRENSLLPTLVETRLIASLLKLPTQHSAKARLMSLWVMAFL